MENEELLNPQPKKARVSPLLKDVFLLAFFLSLAAYFYMIVHRRMEQNRFLMENQIQAIKLDPQLAPNLPIYDFLKNQELLLDSFRGKYVLLNFWATWCPACLSEMPSLEIMHKNFGDKIVIIALSMDDDLGSVVNYVKENNPSFKVYFAKNKEIAKMFKVDKYPESFLISPQGTMISQFSGPRDWASEGFNTYFSNLK